MAPLAALVLALAMAGPSMAATDWAAIRCGRSGYTRPLPTVTYADQKGLFTVCADTLIAAPMADVYAALFDFRSYSLWNSFVVEAEVSEGVDTPEDVYVGMEMVFTSAGLLPFDRNASSDEVVSLLRPHPTELPDDADFAMGGWRNVDATNGVLLRAEHPNILTKAGDALTRVVSYETFYGPAAAAVLPLRSKLMKQFEQQAADLKAYVEGNA